MRNFPARPGNETKHMRVSTIGSDMYQDVEVLSSSITVLSNYCNILNVGFEDFLMICNTTAA